MKKTAFIFVSTLFFLLLGGCQESTKSNNNQYQNNYCYYNPTAAGCSGTTGTGNTCQQNPAAYGCPNHPCTISPSSQACVCAMNPTANGCSGTTSGGTTGTTNPCLINPYAPGCNGVNPYPNYYSAYVPKNWEAQYPYTPSLDCTPAQDPVNVEYTPHDTRQGTITLSGARSYNPLDGNFFTTTSLALRTKEDTQKFLWGDSILKVRFKSNIQPYSRKTSNVCPGRAAGQSTIKGYGKLRFNFILVGVKGNIEKEIFSRQIEAKVNSCTSAISLSNYLETYDSLYFKIDNVQSNQYFTADNRFWPGSEELYDQYGYITPQNKYVENTWSKVRDAECWSLDIEVASDGTKTF